MYTKIELGLTRQERRLAYFQDSQKEAIFLSLSRCPSLESVKPWQYEAFAHKTVEGYHAQVLVYMVYNSSRDGMWVGQPHCGYLQAVVGHYAYQGGSRHRGPILRIWHLHDIGIQSPEFVRNKVVRSSDGAKENAVVDVSLTLLRERQTKQNISEPMQNDVFGAQVMARSPQGVRFRCLLAPRQPFLAVVLSFLLCPALLEKLRTLSLPCSWPSTVMIPVDHVRGSTHRKDIPLATIPPIQGSKQGLGEAASDRRPRRERPKGKSLTYFWKQQCSTQVNTPR